MALNEDDKNQIEYLLANKRAELPDWFQYDRPPTNDPTHGMYSWAVYKETYGYAQALEDVLKIFGEE